MTTWIDGHWVLVGMAFALFLWVKSEVHRCHLAVRLSTGIIAAVFVVIVALSINSVIHLTKLNYFQSVLWRLACESESGNERKVTQSLATYYRIMRLDGELQAIITLYRDRMASTTCTGNGAPATEVDSRE